MWVNIYILLLFSNFSQSKLQPLKKEEKTTPKSRLNGSINKNSINIYITEKMNIYPKFLQDLVLFQVTFDYLEEICKHVKQKPHSFIIFEDDLNKLSNALTLVLSSELVTGNTKYIVLTTLKENIKELGELLWKFRLPYGHIFFLNSHDMKVYRLDVKKCGSDITVKRMETNKHLLNYPLRQEFNIKSAFKKCPLYIIWAIMPPMVIGVNESLPGIYIELMKVFEIASGRKLIYRPYDQIYTEEISSSYYFGTLLEDFAKEYAEIFVGSIDQYTIGMFDITPVLWSNNILLLIPRTISNVWESLIPQLVVIQFFFGLGLLFGIALIFYYLAKVTIDRYMYTSLTKVYLMLFGIVLGVPCLHRNPKTQILRIYFGKNFAAFATMLR